MATASIIGTGLIGASIGLALRETGWDVAGWDPDPGSLEVALDREALDSTLPTRDALLATHADLLVVAAPPRATVELISALEYDGLVTDVTGVKEPVVAAGSHLRRFVPGHPMAGREVSGADAASASLFRGATWVLVPGTAPDKDFSAVSDVVESIGARPVSMTAVDHDAAVAVVSHLPQLLAAALVRQAATSGLALELAAGNFRDLTRVALSDPESWSELLAANRRQVSAAAALLIEGLREWVDTIEEGDAARLESVLATARDVRSALAPPVVAVGVALIDRPGELARVGRAFGASRVDVRDLQLRHAPHGGGGILSVYVRPGEAEALQTALRNEGLLVIA